MQGIHGKERKNRKSKQKEKNTLDSYRPSWKELRRIDFVCRDIVLLPARLWFVP